MDRINILSLNTCFVIKKLIWYSQYRTPNILLVIIKWRIVQFLFFWCQRLWCAYPNSFYDFGLDRSRLFPDLPASVLQQLKYGFLTLFAILCFFCKLVLYTLGQLFQKVFHTWIVVFTLCSVCIVHV